jgi:hypothetical protein
MVVGLYRCLLSMALAGGRDATNGSSQLEEARRQYRISTALLREQEAGEWAI